jgi:predicted HTH domain antitoxin
MESAACGSQEIEIATVTVEVPDSAFSALRRSPEEFAQEMQIAAAIQWYHQRLISQSKAAAIAGLNRREFLTALYNAKVEASQVDIEEMKEDVERDLHSRRERRAADLLDQGGAARSTAGAGCRSPGA